MIESKKSFVAYLDWKDTFDSLPDDMAGKLIKHIFAHVNGEDPASDFVIKAIFSNIKNTLNRDFQKWEKQLEQRRNAGKKSAENRALTKSNERSISLNETQRNPTDSVSVSDSVSVNNDLKVDWDALKLIFNKITGKNTLKITDKTRKQIIARLKDGYSREQIVKAIENCYKDDYHKETNHKHLTLEFISRPDKMEKYATLKPVKTTEKRTGEKL